MNDPPSPAPRGDGVSGTSGAERGYLSGFANEHATEALPGALPVGQNSPQRPPYRLYAEQLSGTAFTLPRAASRRSWLYRIRPALLHGTFEPLAQGHLAAGPDEVPAPPTQLRWDPLPVPGTPTDLVQGLFTVAACGGPATQAGCAVHLYAASRSMADRFFYDADGELLLVPWEGRLGLFTELGRIEVRPGELAVVPRGVRFRAELPDGTARGYVCETFGAPFRLPELGPVGANGLANARDFLAPCAAFEDREGDFELVARFQGHLWRAPIDHSPLDVVAWHGNYTPYKYDLARFNTLGSVSFDHPDPSIFTVLTSPSEVPGLANVDVVVFPPRWQVAEHTFRPPWFHRNVMSEYMGLVRGAYDARAEGFVPGGGSLHNCMSGHGPDAATFEQASQVPLLPRKLDDTLAFMFESRFVLRPTRAALASPQLQRDYAACWRGLARRFDGKP